VIEAKVILDSTCARNKRITTMQLRYPRFIHAEFMTHRVFSRNASSSRAVPTAKLLEEVRTAPASPVFWGMNQPGMQAALEFEGREREELIRAWQIAANNAADAAESMSKFGAHKQIVNRILEPFTHINVVVTATEWENFFGLRIHKDAQPEMRALAEAMWASYSTSDPTMLRRGEWHLPYVDYMWVNGEQKFYWQNGEGEEAYFNAVDLSVEQAAKISVARCARVSYKAFDGKVAPIESDLKLYEKLAGAQPLHASPLEHQATPDGTMSSGGWANPRLHGNFVGWNQYRKSIAGEAVAPFAPLSDK
jgi:hypothetical protein